LVGFGAAVSAGFLNSFENCIVTTAASATRRIIARTSFNVLPEVFIGGLL
jgi:hypothetical protein